MIAVDTNILVRVLVDDPGSPQQVRLARSAVSRAKRVFVPQPVLIETLWVLGRSYGFDRATQLMVLNELQHNQAFELEHRDSFDAALELFRDAKLDFADALIVSIAQQHDLTLLSFDRKLARQQGTRLVK